MVSKKTCGNCHAMNSPSAIAADAREMLLFAAGPLGWEDNKKSAIARAARLVGISYSRAFNIIYGRSRRLEASEYLTIRRSEEGSVGKECVRYSRSRW